MNTKERILRIVAVALLAYSLWSFVSVQLELRRAARLSEELDARLAELQDENDELNEKLAHSRDDASIERIARERLGLVMPGEIVFYFISDREE